MRINHNIAALNTYNQLSKNSSLTNKALGKLSSGLRINQAGDDPAGLSISEKMRAQIRGLNQATRNAQDGISLVQTAEGALNETSSILQRMRELAVQAGNDTATSTDRATIQSEMDQLANEITRIADTTKFNGKELMSTTTAFSGVLQIGSDSGQTLSVSMTSMDAVTLSVANYRSADATYSGTGGGLDTGNLTVDTSSYTLGVEELDITITFTAVDTATVDINGTEVVGISTGTAAGDLVVDSSNFAGVFQAGESITITNSVDWVSGNTTVANLALEDNVAGLAVDSNANASTALTAIDGAIDTVSTQRSTLGSYQNRLEHTIKNLGTAAENMTAAESRIRDVDMASEMMEFTKMNILSQAAQSMLAQANAQPQNVLQLLG